MKWRSMSLRILKLHGSDESKKLRSMKICGKWNLITTKMLKFHKLKMNLKLGKFMQKYLNTRQMKIFCKFASMARRYSLKKFNQRRLSALGKWSKLAKRYLKLRHL